MPQPTTKPTGAGGMLIALLALAVLITWTRAR
jgi:hypothetical protein